MLSVYNISLCHSHGETYCHVLGWLKRTVLDWMIGFINTLYIHATRDYRQYSSIANLHIFQFTVAQALSFSVFTSRILATDLSQFLCNLNSYSLIPFLPFLQLPIRKTQLDCCFLLRHFFLLCPLITPRNGPHGKHRLLLSTMLVFWSVT
jgi:hypothetical protein